MVKRRPARAATKAPAPSPSTPRKRKDPAESSPLWLSICSEFLPNALVITVAAAAVWFEFTTGRFTCSPVAPDAAQALVHRLGLLGCAYAAYGLRDAAGTRASPAVTQEGGGPPRPSAVRRRRCQFTGNDHHPPGFGAAPQFEETVRLVVPIYFLVEVVLDGLRIPLPLLKAVVGLSVSWLKAVTIPKLVMEWHTNTDAHPLGFLAISTANLYASGLVLRYLTNYGRTHRVLDLSLGAFAFILQIVGTSAVIGVVAHVANHFVTNEERMMEARVLYFCVAWFALDKYWKKALGDLLVQLLTSPPSRKQTRTYQHTNGILYSDCTNEHFLLTQKTFWR